MHTAFLQGLPCQLSRQESPTSTSRSRCWKDGKTKFIYNTLGLIDHNQPHYPNNLFGVTQCSNWTDQHAHNVPHIHSSITYSTSYANKNQIILGWKDALHLSVAYGNLEGLGKIKEKCPSNMPTPKHSLLAKTIIWYLNDTNSQATSMQVSLTFGTLQNLPNPTNLMTGVMLQRESNIK